MSTWTKYLVSLAASIVVLLFIAIATALIFVVTFISMITISSTLRIPLVILGFLPLAIWLVCNVFHNKKMIDDLERNRENEL